MRPLLFLLLLLIQPPVLEPGTPLVVTLDGGPTEVRYMGQAGEIITLSAHALDDETLDPTLELLQNNQRLAYNDDHLNESDTLAAQDSQIGPLLLDETGTYRLQIDSFNGVQSGRIELRLDSQPQVQPCQSGEISLRAGTVFACTLDLNAGQTLTVTARDSSNSLDPMLRLLDASGTVLAANDDHAGLDLTLNQLDAQLDPVPIAAAGTYRVEVRDFAGQAGRVALTIISS